jgi:hypothetical protein
VGVVAAWRFLVNGTLPRAADRHLIRPDSKAPQRCDTSKDCKVEKEICIENECHVPKEMHCTVDSDCVFGLICDDKHICVPKFPCHNDSDCFANERCYPISGCAAILAGSPCETRENCGLNMYCVEGVFFFRLTSHDPHPQTHTTTTR